MLRERLQLAREAAVRLAVELRHPGAELLQQRGQRDAADARAAIHHDVECALADRGNVDVRQAEHAIEMPGERVRLLADGAQLVPAGPEVVVLLEARPDLGSLALAEELTAGAQELERVPWGRVVARGEDDAARRAQMLDGELRGGCGGEADVHDVPAGGVDAGRRGQAHDRARNAGVAAENDRALVGKRARERRGEARDDRWIERLADDAAHA